MVQGGRRNADEAQPPESEAFERFSGGRPVQLPVTKPRRYRAPRPLSDFGLEKVPRSFRYVEG